MNELLIPQELSVLDKSIYLAQFGKKVFNVLRPLVYEVYEKELWQGRFSSFNEYVQSTDGLGISPGYASKLRQNEAHYVISGGLSPEKLEGIDNESLYMASKLPGTPEEQVAMAKTLTRQELRETKNEVEPCVHDPVQICGKCHIRLTN